MNSASNSIIHLFHQKYRSFVENLASDTKSFDKHLSLCILLCLIPPFWEQVLGHLSSEFVELNDPPNFASEWGITEWLIAYSGGFVRRGITGEIVEYFSLLFDIPPNYVIVGFSIFFYAAIVVWTIRFIGKTYPVYFLLSSFLVGIPVFSGYFIRKDVLIIFLFMCSIWALISRNSKFVKYSLISLISSFAILSHESYFFTGLPLLFVAFCIYEKQKFYSVDTILVFSVPVFCMFLTLVFAGNDVQLLVMMENWNLIYQRVAPEYCCFDYEAKIAAFFALSADMSWHLDLSADFAKRFVLGIFWTPGVWIVLWFLCGGVIARFIHMYDTGNEGKFLALFVFQTICAIPLFIIAIDHGRWIALIAIMSFITLYVIKDEFDVPFENYFLRFSLLRKPLLLWQRIGLVFLFGLPHLWETVEYHIRSIPIFDVILFFVYNY